MVILLIEMDGFIDQELQTHFSPTPYEDPTKTLIKLK